MASTQRRDPEFDGPEMSASASASASANARISWGTYRVVTGRLRALLGRAPVRLRRPLSIGGLSIGGTSGAAQGYLPVEEYAAEDAWVVRVELPGVDPDRDVTISAADGSLHLTAERRHDEPVHSRGTVHSEFRYGTFARTVALPPGADAHDVTAEYKNGILQVRVPIGPDGHPEQRIPITQG